jgi:hypothetical protein
MKIKSLFERQEARIIFLFRSIFSMLLDPDPAGSRTEKSMRIRIHNIGEKKTYQYQVILHLKKDFIQVLF